MTPAEAAAVLNGREYRDEIPSGFADTLLVNGLVAVFGASDDIMYLEGAVSNEIGAYSGTDVYFTKEGLLKSECDDEDCPYFEKLKKKASTVMAKWSDGGFSWRYATDIPHATFVIKEDDGDYCEGIVFALADVPEAP